MQAIIRPVSLAEFDERRAVERKPPPAAIFARYWNDLRRDGTAPLRAFFDPMAVPSVLPHLVLTSVLQDPLDFQYRLIGTHVDERMSANYAGKRLSELDGKSEGSSIWSAFKTSVDECAIIYCRQDYVGPEQDISGTEAFYFPFLGSAGEVSDIITIISFEDDVRLSQPARYTS